MIIYLILGIIAGTIAGLIPGLHTNTISKALLFTPLFGFEAIVFVISMGTVQSFVDFIPSIFIGASDSSTFESVLPGHAMFLEGEAFTAINLTIIGGIIATIVSLLFIPIFIQFIEINQTLFPKMIPLILVFSILHAIPSFKSC
jgi:putative membrane protein